MTTTLEAIHRDPEILDRAIERREQLEIMSKGVVTATLVPHVASSVIEARALMRQRFAKPDWSFEPSQPLTRDERNSRD